MTTDRKKFGEILVANGIISRMTLQRALEKATKENPSKRGFGNDDLIKPIWWTNTTITLTTARTNSLSVPPFPL